MGDAENDSTPLDLGIRRPASAERKAFASVELSVLALARSLRELRECWDGSTPDRQKAMAADVAVDSFHLREAADHLHELMREFTGG